MFLKNRTAQLLVVTYVAMVVAAIVANSQELIFSKVGCWPEYGDTIIHNGEGARAAHTVQCVRPAALLWVEARSH